jgi:hypothetical protein
VRSGWPRERAPHEQPGARGYFRPGNGVFFATTLAAIRLGVAF